MADADKQEGFLVVQESDLGNWCRFFTDRAAAEECAADMTSYNIPTLVIPATRFTTETNR
jgi:hypothetical protein